MPPQVSARVSEAAFGTYIRALAAACKCLSEVEVVYVGPKHPRRGALLRDFQGLDRLAGLTTLK